MTADTHVRRPLVAGNWKLNVSIADGSAIAAALKAKIGNQSDVEVAIAPVFTLLATIAGKLDGCTIGLASQDMYWEDSGAYTGEVGPAHLLDAGCKYAIVGHSERRQFFAEDDRAVQLKTRAALDAGLVPIVCVGESLEARRAGQAEHVVLTQVQAALEGLPDALLLNTVIAYEPIWAIGTGETASPTDAQEMHRAIRGKLSELHGSKASGAIRILYGGSVKPDNAAELMSQPDIDGALVGGASLKVDSFVSIVEAAR